MTITNKEYAEGLRAIADWFEAHPDVPVSPYPEVCNYTVESKEEAVTVAEALKPCVKEYSDTLFTLKRKFGPIELKFGWWRSAVCERRVIGTEDVPEKVIPAHTREIVEWDCHPLLSPGEEPEAAA